MGWRNYPEAEVVEQPQTPEPQVAIRSLQVTDIHGNHYDVSGVDLAWSQDTDPDWVHVRSGETPLASIKDPVRVIALDWSVE